MDNSQPSTSVSLLSRLRREDRDEEAWREFVERYGRGIYGWCLNRTLQPSDAEDVSQNVLVKLARHLCDFEYDESLSFRGWLRRVTENAIKDYLREGQQSVKGEGGSEILKQLEAVEARRELLERLQDAYDLELFEEAVSRVRARIATHRWLAWHLSASERRPAAEVAAELNMKVASVYTARNQVQKMIHDEIQALEQPALESDG